MFKKKLRLKLFPFIFTQAELLELKKFCENKIYTHTKYLVTINKNNMSNYPDRIKDLIEAAKLKKKVKKILLFKNAITGMNNPILDREISVTIADRLQKFSEGKQQNHLKEAYNKVNSKLPRRQKVEELMDNALRKIVEYDKTTTKRNNRIYSFLFSKSPIIREFNNGKRKEILK